LVFLLRLRANADTTWQTADKALAFKAPEGFKQVEKSQQNSTLELFNPKQNVEIVVSKAIQGRVELASYLKNFPSMIKGQGGLVVAQEKTQVAGSPAALFVVSGLVPESLETIYVYVAPAKGSYSFVVNYPSAQRAQVLKLTKLLLATAKRR
jgi:hypothetical protein